MSTEYGEATFFVTVGVPDSAAAAEGMGSTGWERFRGRRCCSDLNYDLPPMKRTAIAAAWLAGVTLPLLLAAVFVFGCCVLPFHRVMHNLMPICEMAAEMMRGEHGDHDHGQQSTPAREKEQPTTRVATDMPHVFRLAPGAPTARYVSPGSSTAYRSFITLGAVRCDQDIGLRLTLLDTFRI